jgi:hypothetical protein
MQTYTDGRPAGHLRSREAPLIAGAGLSRFPTMLLMSGGARIGAQVYQGLGGVDLNAQWQEFGLNV